jgi:hypothetical protein
MQPTIGADPSCGQRSPAGRVADRPIHWMSARIPVVDVQPNESLCTVPWPKSASLAK